MFPFISTIILSTVLITPPQVMQGEPFMVTIDVPATTTVQSVTFDAKPVGVFQYHSKPTALVGVDLNAYPGIHELTVTTGKGVIKKQTVSVPVIERKKEIAVLGIPEKLGGNSTSSVQALVGSLSDENAVLAQLKTGLKAFWTEPFQYPINTPIVTDPYGYSRETGTSLITHKGTDFRAKEGTPVYASNRGVVRLVKTFRVYGKTVIVDHGLGVMTFYMHLSDVKVNQGELVKRGQLIAKSGSTGYAEQPHLHLTVRLNGVSIDPVKFFRLFE